jgi:superfamily I DNA/RNA helicase/PHP family Zn ribbon phosphoesterase
MRIIADLHIHSPYSRATSRRNSPAYLDRWTRIKGISLAGTGDCTHPQWLAELREALTEAEEGFYVLKDEFRRDFDRGPALTEELPTPALDSKAGGSQVQDVRGHPVRFVLSGEISTIYSRDGKTRKVHHVILLPDFEAAAAFQTRLERVGNIRSDGRPILGLDSRDLLELLLESDPRSILIPAHIWTPWFSALGGRSGFDSIDDCYRDLAPHIHAIETGLSSNPPMNWAVSSLDRFSIISNSDAHSPEKLGREATILEMDPSYAALAAALSGFGTGATEAVALAGTLSREPATGPAILETVEFFPQEGKYHYDGHRLCSVSLGPEAAAALEGMCPVCGKPMTPGVMGRVQELADRPVSEDAPCPADSENTNRRPYRSLIPLPEILGEILDVGTASKRVSQAYGMLIEKAGSEFAILMDKSIGDLEKLNCPGISGERLASAVDRMRRGEVSITPGYDGEYGIIRCGRPAYRGIGLFGDEASAAVPSEVPAPESAGPGAAGEPARPRAAGSAKKTGEGRPLRRSAAKAPPKAADRDRFTPDPDQERAINHSGGPALIIAGPGTGKTAVLARRIARIMGNGLSRAGSETTEALPLRVGVLALSFTVKAAEELRERTIRMLGTPELPGEHPATLPAAVAGLTVGTFHSLGRSILKAEAAAAGIPEDFTILDEEGRTALLAAITAGKKPSVSPGRLGLYVEERKRFLLLPGDAAIRLGPQAATLLGAAIFEAAIPLPNADLDRLYGEYRDTLKAKGLLDFDDLLAGPVRLLSAKPELLAKYRERFTHIFADEYQDINFAQYALLRLLGQGEICVIGDPNQAIYGFRGASNRYIGRFLADYPGAAVYNLRKSFRCAEPIMQAANALTGAGLRGASAASPGTGGEVSLYRTAFPTDRAEAEGIARRISVLIGGTGFFAIDSGVTGGGGNTGGLTSLGQCAILIRAAVLAAPMEEALKNHGIPYRLMGEDLEDIKWSTEEVALMTIHASKGLEFDHVFVAGLEDGILPFTLFGEKTAEDIAEEKRILYVAMTRARRGLHLSWAGSRSFRGRSLTQPPSRFLADLEKLVPELKHGIKRDRNPQMELF